VKAVALQRFGGPDVLRVHELPDRHAGPGEIRIRVRAAAVSPADTLIRAGAAAPLLQGPPPYVPGLDAAGVVDEIGPGSRAGLAVGDPVVALVNPTPEAAQNSAPGLPGKMSSATPRPTSAPDWVDCCSTWQLFGSRSV